VSTAGDVNGDQLSDVIIGASEYLSDTDSIGAAFVYHGTPDLVADNDSPTILGETTTLSATVSVSGAFTFDWNFGDGSANSSGQVVQHIYPAVGMYMAVVTATSGTTVLTKTTDVSIEISIADLAADNDSPTALGQATAFSATISAGTNVSYEWDFDDGSAGSGANVSHTYSAVGSYTATVTATNGISSDSTTTMVTVDETIAGISADNDSPTVLGDTTSFSVITTAGSNLSYEWDFGDGSPTESGRVITHTYTAVGSYTTTVTGTNSVSSDTTTTTVLIEEAIAGLSAENDSPTALGDTTTLTGTITAGTDVSYEWDFGDGSPTVSGQTVTHDYGAVGLYTAILTATNQVGSDTTTTSVTIDETIAGLSANNDSPTSLGDTTNLTATLTAGSNVTYKWDFGDSTPTETGKIVGHDYTAVGSYTATVTATNSISSDTTTTEVTIDDTISGLSAVNDGPTVLGETTTLIASITGGSGITYEWDFGDGSSTGSGKTVTHEYSTVGSYTAIVTATNSVGSSTANTTVIVDQTISGLSAENDGPTTLGETTTLTATITAGSNASYEWDFGDGSPKESGAVVTHDYDAVGGYTAIVTATNSVSSQTTTTVVTVQDIPIEGLIAGNDSPTIVGGTTTLSGSVSAGSNVTYEWDFGDGSPTETGATVTHVYSSADTYIARVTAKNGVSSQNKTTIVVIYPYQNYLPIIYYEK
jgi:PKD repeat protein